MKWSLAALALVSPAAALAQTAPVPLAPEAWASSVDRLCNAHDCYREGTVAFDIAVSAAGRVTGCTITQSSGIPSLDEETCRFLVRRARFRPALDRQGRPVEGRWQSRMHWRVPDAPADASAGDTPAQQASIEFPLTPAVTTPSPPQPTNNPIIWSAGDWDLFEARKLRMCALRRFDTVNDVLLGVMKSGTGPMLLRVRLPADPQPGEPVRFRLGEMVLPAEASVESSATFAATAEASGLLAQLAKTDTFEVLAGSTVRASVTLGERDDREAGLAELVQCAAQWPDLTLPASIAPISRAPRPPIPVPNLAGPFAPGLAPQPLGKENWVLAGDYPLHAIYQREEGRVVARLGVSAEGRTASCTVIVSSGFARLDQATCNTLTRYARFQPATDREGKPIAATFDVPVNWVMPEGTPAPVPLPLAGG